MTLKNNWVNGDFVGADDLNATATQVNTNTGDITAVASGKADKSRSITAGAGLTGGGDLTANRTLAADFGTGAGKVCQGNDPRLSDPRTPGDNTVTPAKLHSTVFGTSSGTVVQGNDSRLAAPQAPSSDTMASGSTVTAAVTTPRHRMYVTALAVAATIAAPTGSPANGWQNVYRIQDDGTARALTWNAVFRAVGVTLPTTTVAGKTLYVAAEYNSAASTWDVLAVGQAT